MSERIVRRVVVRGKVQGVGFRAFIEDEAAIYDVEGYVRNRKDGTVEAVFAGTAAAVDAMTEMCRTGPETSEIVSVEVDDAQEADLGQRPPGEKFAMLLTA